MRSTNRIIRAVAVAMLLLAGLLATMAPAAAQPDEDEPDCDEDGWRIVTNEDGDGFRSENHCEDHVADNGEESLVSAVAPGDDGHVVVTMAERSGGFCFVNITLVYADPDQMFHVEIFDQNGPRFRMYFVPGGVRDWGAGLLETDDRLTDGTAELVDGNRDPTGETIPVYLPEHRVC